MNYTLKLDDACPVRGRTKHETNDDRRRAVPVRLHSSLMILYLLDCISDLLYIDRSQNTLYIHHFFSSLPLDVYNSSLLGR